MEATRDENKLEEDNSNRKENQMRKVSGGLMMQREPDWSATCCEFSARPLRHSDVSLESR
jgi:hypothetical protein